MSFWRRLLAALTDWYDDPDEGVFGDGDFGWRNVESGPDTPGDQPGPDSYQWSPE